MSSWLINLLLPESHIGVDIEVGDMVMEVELLDCEIEETEAFEEPGESEVDGDAEEAKLDDLMSNVGLDDADFDVEVDEFSDLLSPVGTLLMVVLVHGAKEESGVSAAVMIESSDLVNELAPIDTVVVKKVELV
ncbi:hypothetical protein ACHAO8_009703 [Botrytis cinerea]